jgi:hypothetical protein
LKKKCLLFVILSLILLAVPVMADAPFRLFVDNVLVDKPVVMIDGTAYAPIRVVADMLNAKTQWISNNNGNTVWITSHAKLERPPIKGDAEFVTKINEALDLLEEKDFPHYVMVCEYVYDIAPLLTKDPPEIIKNAYAFSGFCTIRIMPLLIDDSQRFTPVYLAGVLAHEACHATTSKYDKLGTEKDAYAHQLAVYKTLNAPQWMQNECIAGINNN